ncbi:PolC-type DNA polymerase III [bacterium]|nr:PolC-type DNA polymerase III [bacterium]
MKAIIDIDSGSAVQTLNLQLGDAGEVIRITRLCIDSSGVIELHIESADAEAIAHVPALRKAVSAWAGEHATQVVVRARYASEQSVEDYLRTHWQDICYELRSCGEKVLGFLEPSAWSVSNGHLTISVCSDLAAKALDERGCGAILQQCIKRDIGSECIVSFAAGDFTAQIEQNLQQRMEAAQEEARAQAEQQSAERGRVVYDTGKCKAGEPQGIRDIITTGAGRKPVTIDGKIISFDPPRAGNDFSPARFSITDYTSSIECVIFSGSRGGPNSGPKQGPPIPALAPGEWVRATGSLELRMRDRNALPDQAPEFNVRIERIERIDDPARQDAAADKRVELHAHTKMSQMDGVTDLSELVARAARWGHPAIGITDHGNVHCFPDLHSLARKHKIKALFGMEAYLANHPAEIVAAVAGRKGSGDKGLTRDDKADFMQKVFHIILYVKNAKGLRNLYDLVTLSHCEYFYGKPLIPREVLEAKREGLVVGSACERGEIYRLALELHTKRITQAEFEERISHAAPLYDYFEIQPLANNLFYVAKGILQSEDDLKAINRRICDEGARLGKPVAATGDVHVLDEHETLYRRILHVGQDYEAGGDESDTPLFFRTTGEMLAEFAYLGDETARAVVIDNPRRIIDAVESVSPIPSGFHPPTIDGSEDELTRLCASRCAELYGEHPHPLVLKRMHRELDDIIRNHFADLYMLAQKLVRKSLDDGYIVGSRGSVGSSFVAFLSGITEVNSLPAHYTCPRCFRTEFIHFDDKGEPRAEPLDGIAVEVGVDLPPRACPACKTEMNRDGFDIPFETFVGFEGNKTPDIDLNFASEYQSRAHQYVEQLFGREFVFRAGTIATLQDRTTFGFVKKYLEQTGEQWPAAEINRIALGLTGIKRTTGQHPGGMIILPKNKAITEFTPVHFPANDARKGQQTTHFDYHSMEEQLLKLDILGHDDPTKIRLLTEYLGTDVTAVPLNDKATLSIFAGLSALNVREQDIGTPVGTFGIPEFGTEFVRGMLIDTRPKTFADLIRISGLSHGTDVWLNNARDIIKEGRATLAQVICTRDDIMNGLIAKGMEPRRAFKIMEQVRKGKGLSPDDVKHMRQHGVPEWYVDSCQKIKYMFPKAHAVAYVLNAMRVAYCKVHHPVAYYATMFTIMREAADAVTIARGRDAIKARLQELLRAGRRNLNANEQDTLNALELAMEMTCRGIRMRAVDIDKSEATKCVIENNEIIPPFTTFPGLGASAAESVIEARGRGPFSSREDFLRRTKCNRTIVEQMAAAGILSHLAESDQMDLMDMLGGGQPAHAPAGTPADAAHESAPVKAASASVDDIAAAAVADAAPVHPAEPAPGKKSRAKKAAGRKPEPPPAPPPAAPEASLF